MILDLIDKHLEINKTLVNLLCSLIWRIPDNVDDIKRLSNQAFIVNLSTIWKYGRMDAASYDIQYQKRVIVEIIKKRPMHNIKTTLQEIIDKGKVFYDHSYVRFHPTVLFNLDRIMKGDLKWLRKHLRNESSKPESKSV